MSSAGDTEPAVSSAPESTANEAELAALEAELAELASGGEAVEPAQWPRLAALEGRLCQFECANRATREHPVLAAASDWRDALEAARAEDAVLEVDRIVAGLHLLALRRLEHGTCGSDDVEAEALFDALLAVGELRHRVAGRANALGVEPGQVDTRAVIEESRHVRDQLRQRLVDVLAGGPSYPERWVDLVIDAADEALLSAGETPPRVSAQRLAESVEALRWFHGSVASKGPVPEALRRLKRCIGRLEAEREEQLLTARLERRFGAGKVKLWERGVFVALLLVVVLLVLDVTGTAPRGSHWLDLTLCTFFLWDFGVRATLIGFRPRWLRRHVATDLLPALPWSFMLGAPTSGADPARAGWLLRALRLARMAAPGMRLIRAVGFLSRGLDRLVRRNARLLEQEVLLFPTVAERRALRESDGHDRSDRRFELRARLDSLFESTLRATAEGPRARLAALRARAFEEATQSPWEFERRASPRELRRAQRPLAEDLLHRLERVTASEVEGEVGVESARRISRGARMVARSPLRFMPLLRRWIPRGARVLPDDEVAAGTVRAVARSLGRWHDRVLWWADLSTTVTPAEIVGRVGSTLVTRTSRPAVRLLLLSGIVLVLELVFNLLGIATAKEEGIEGTALQNLFWTLKGLVTVVLYALGGFCLVLVAVGVWLQRLARDATTFHERVARAQFLHLTDTIKARDRGEDADLFAERVFLPERRLRDLDGASEAAERDAARFQRHFVGFVADGVSPPSAREGHDPVARAVLLYRDLLDGALFAHSDTRSTGQLLGNLAVQRLVERSRRMGRDDLRALHKLDLERRRTLVSGPYIWFHAITRALASRAARLIVEFNGNAIPLDELKRCTAEERAAYEAWLASDPGHVAEERRQLTTAFTMLHFLDDSDARDAEVERRFGHEVVERLRRERRTLVRSVLGCWPLSSRPLEERVLNLRSSYDEWVAGGRILLLPGRLLLRSFRIAGFAFGRLFEAVESIRHPDTALSRRRPRQEDFASALRKVDRMRLPAALEALRLRARFDPEYLGLDLPGIERTEESEIHRASEVDRDLAFLRAPAELEEEIARVRIRAGRDLRLLARLEDGGLLGRIAERLQVAAGDESRGEAVLDAESVRALALLFHADVDGVRCAIAGDDVLVEAGREAARRGLEPGRWPRPGLRRRFERWWDDRGAELCAPGRSEDSKGDGLAAERRASMWAAIVHDVDGARAALATVGTGPRAAREAGESALAAAVRHPEQVTEQLTTLRTIQTGTLIDVRNYRRHAYELGRYGEEEQDADWAAAFTPQ